MDSIPGLGRSPGEGKGYSCQYSGLENSMDGIVHRVTRSQTRLNDFHTFFLGAADTAVHTKTRSQGIHILLEGKNVKRKQTFKINSE